MPLGPVGAKPPNPEAAGAGGRPGLQQRRAAADHQHTGSRLEELGTAHGTRSREDTLTSSLIVSQNLSLEKPKKPKSAKIWGHSRTLSRVEVLGMVRRVRNRLCSTLV